MWTSPFASIFLYIPLGSRKHHDLRQILELQRPQAKEVSRRRRLEGLRSNYDCVRRSDLPSWNRCCNNPCLISYPLVYAVQNLPLSISRCIGFVQENRGDRKNHVPPTALIAMQVIHLLSGLTNVVLFLFTRPNLLLFKRPEDERRKREAERWRNLFQAAIAGKL